MNGVIVINKPMEFTSFDVVAVVRKALNTKKVGHCGTLDPNATGVLPVLVGRAVKAQDILPNHDKSYVATFRLGVVTDTLDIWGKVQKEEKTSVKKAELLSELQKFRGETEQIPPMFSAVKVDGKRLYDLAREGKEVKREARKITVYDLRLLEFDEDTQEGKLYVSCSKGTYIRTLIDDIAKCVCIGGTMTSLVRDSACGFSLESAITLEELKALCEKGCAEEKILPTESLFTAYKEVFVSPLQAKRFANGGTLDARRIKEIPTLSQGEILRVKCMEKDFWALGRYFPDTKEIKVYKQFCDFTDAN
ncbi:MAG: tRNA pseudouridine(55) synthase TruB [Eubacteriales bacterium]|nr:tRNA pseudouridine(55) synthase TruB [Eubacteriales bacterium]